MRPIIAISALLAAAFMGSTLVSPLWGLFQKKFGFSEITLTLIYAAYVVGNLAALLFFGRLSDQLGRRKIGAPAVGIAIVAACLFFFAQSETWLYAARALTGFAVGMASGTATAWLAEIYGESQRGPATVMATVANQIGIAIGPLMAGILAEYAPLPLELPFAAYIVLLIATGIVVHAWPPETVRSPIRTLADLELRPRVGVPEDIRLQFIAPVVAAFATFALTGFYYALLPTVLNQALHNSNVAVAGAVIFEMISITVAVLLVARDLSSRTAMFTALVLIFPSAALLVLTQSLHSMPILLVAGAFTGCTLALGYRGSLQVVNEIAPNDRRAEVVSAYLIACFAGNSIPVIGVGVLATYANLLTASVVFAAVLAIMSLGALTAGRITSRRVFASRS